ASNGTRAAGKRREPRGSGRGARADRPRDPAPGRCPLSARLGRSLRHHAGLDADPRRVAPPRLLDRDRHERAWIQARAGSRGNDGGADHRGGAVGESGAVRARAFQGTEAERDVRGVLPRVIGVRVKSGRAATRRRTWCRPPPRLSTPIRPPYASTMLLVM